MQQQLRLCTAPARRRTQCSRCTPTAQTSTCPTSCGSANALLYHFLCFGSRQASCVPAAQQGRAEPKPVVAGCLHPCVRTLFAKKSSLCSLQPMCSGCCNTAGICSVCGCLQRPALWRDGRGAHRTIPRPCQGRDRLCRQPGVRPHCPIRNQQHGLGTWHIRSGRRQHVSLYGLFVRSTAARVCRDNRCLAANE